jgi:hypothetical protein
MASRTGTLASHALMWSLTNPPATTPREIRSRKLETS